MDTKQLIEEGKTSLGIELGSTRIKAVLINEKGTPLAAGSHEWENRYDNGIWTYTMEDVWEGLQDCYQDLLKAFYGVTTRDYRLNLAEYIGGSRYPIYTSEVLQTSETQNTPLGDQAGHAIGSGNSSHGSYFVEELGCILNLFWITTTSNILS